MRRVLLLVTGLCLGGLLLTVFCAEVSNTPVLGTGAEMTSEEPTQSVWTLPCKIPGTCLTAQTLAVYDGPFYEDGSGDEVIGVTALVLHNDGDAFLRWGEVALEAGEVTLRFAFTSLPPDATILVPERGRQEESPSAFVGCCGAVEEARDEFAENIRLGAKDAITLTVTNLGQERREAIQIYYKTYDSLSRMYVGGNTYMVTVQELEPGETAEISPYHYVKNYTKVVAVTDGK